MGWLTRILGGEQATPVPVDPVDRGAIIAVIRRGEQADIDAALEIMEDDEAFALLWDLLDNSAGMIRVDIVDRIADFELDGDQQRRLLLAGVEAVPATAWTATSIAMSCDLVAITKACANGQTGDGTDPLLEAIGQVLGALCEATLASGPSGDAFDIANSAEACSVYADVLCETGASPVGLIAVQLAFMLCHHPGVDGEASAQGWNADLADHLQEAASKIATAGPRGGGTWTDRLVPAISTGDMQYAVGAATAAPLVGVATEAAIIGRVAGDPDDEIAWAMATLQPPTGALLETLVPLLVQTLQFRRLGADELCSPASQAGCMKCGGATPADDDDMMVPKTLEARALPVVGALIQTPGEHADLLYEAVAAPSPSLRFNGLFVLGRWPASAIDNNLWELIESLHDDSMPQVRERVEALLQSRHAAA